MHLATQLGTSYLPGTKWSPTGVCNWYKLNCAQSKVFSFDSAHFAIVKFALLWGCSCHGWLRWYFCQSLWLQKEKCLVFLIGWANCRFLLLFLLLDSLTLSWIMNKGCSNRLRCLDSDPHRKGLSVNGLEPMIKTLLRKYVWFFRYFNTSSGLNSK